MSPDVPSPDGAPVVRFDDAAAFEAWMSEHAEDRAGVWMLMARAGSGVTTITDDEAVDSGLCLGWVSGQRRAHDERFYLQKYVPRRPRSRWSMVNVRKVEALTAAGRMQPAGLAEVEAARADGRWDAAYPSQAEASTPDDLAAALADDDRARAAYDALGRTERYAVILDVVTARRPAARAERVRRAVERLADRLSGGA